MWRKFYSEPKRLSFCLSGLLIAVVSLQCIAQSNAVVIGSMEDRPNALLFLNPPDKNQGFLVPQLTTKQRLGMHPNSPQEDGLFLFDVNDKCFYFWKNGTWIKGLGDTPESGIPSELATGDLSGSYPSPVVSRLQGNEVAPGTLTAADAGKVLVWSGTQWMPQAVTGSGKTTRYAMIDPSAFTNLRQNDKKDKDNIIMFDDNSTFVTTIKKNEGPYIIAPLSLPDGATIQEVSLYYMDREVKNIVFNLYRKNPLQGNESVISTWSSNGNTPSIQMSAHPPRPGMELIDNSNYSYRIVIELDQSNDVSASNDATLRVYAVKIKYLL